MPNILVTKAGVLDFGLAKIEKPVPMGITVEGQILGTLLYMSPEQLNGKEADPRSDIFSFGLVLYEVLSGKRAFGGSTAASVIAAILERPAPSVADIAPPALDRALKTYLAKDPDDRWQSARDLKRELEWIATAPTESAPIPARRPLIFGSAILAAFLVAAVTRLGLPEIRRQYSVTPDGQRFLANVHVDDHPQTILLQNWFSREP
jgi:serine/threonine protein kinase